MKKLLVIGVDPGATVGYALLDLKGKLVKLRSSKKLTIPLLVLETMKQGLVVVAGCDVNPPPNFVKKVATRIGAKLVFPEETLRIKTKNELTKKHKIRNKHEKDALASAIYAHKKITHLLTKIDVMLKKKNKEELNKLIKRLLLTQSGLSIDRAIKKIENNKD